MATRAKFKCDAVTHLEYQRTVKLSTQYSQSPEDNQFVQATPWGNLEMMITSVDVFDFFVPGQSYYLDFTPATL